MVETEETRLLGINTHKNFLFAPKFLEGRLELREKEDGEASSLRGSGHKKWCLLKECDSAKQGDGSMQKGGYGPTLPMK